jgi:nucleoside-diphosphate-sugar epimerase
MQLDTHRVQVTAKQAIETKNPVLAYYASKKLAEHTAWDFMENEKPTFDLTCSSRPVRTPVKSPTQIEKSTAQFVYSLFNGARKTAQEVEGDYFIFSHIDGRDLARAHVKSLTLPAASNQRITLTTDEIFSPQAILNVLNKHFPELKDRVATGNPDQLFSTGFDPTLFTGAKARSVESSIKDVTAQLLEQEKGFSVGDRLPSLMKITY